MSKKAASTVKAAAAPAPVAGAKLQCVAPRRGSEAVAPVPLRGSLYAQLLCSDDQRLKLRCSQKVG